MLISAGFSMEKWERVGHGACVMGHGSWVVGRGSCVMGHGSWGVGRVSWVWRGHPCPRSFESIRAFDTIRAPVDAGSEVTRP